MTSGFLQQRDCHVLPSVRGAEQSVWPLVGCSPLHLLALSFFPLCRHFKLRLLQNQAQQSPSPHPPPPSLLPSFTSGNGHHPLMSHVRSLAGLLPLMSKAHASLSLTSLLPLKPALPSSPRPSLESKLPSSGPWMTAKPSHWCPYVLQEPSSTSTKGSLNRFTFFL